MAKPPTFISTLTALANNSLGMLGFAEKDMMVDVATDAGVIAPKVRQFLYQTIRTVIGQLRPEELIVRETLTTPEDISSNANYDYAYRYTLPDDYIGTLWYDEDAHLVEGGYVYCNYPEEYVFRYIKYSIDPSEWSGELVEVMRYRIAQSICIPLTDNEVKNDALLNESKRVIEPICERIMSYGKKYPNNRYKRTGLSYTRGRI